MKVMYIPVSSLNFNNIFASESISPVAFYTKRNFGYKTFEKIEQLNRFDNSIIAFDKFPVFKIKADGRDNFPMVIEIIAEFDNLPVKTLDDVTIFQCSETIYLNPFNTKVYFLSEEARKITVLGAERSLSTKMVSLYEKLLCFSVLNKESNVSDFQFKSDTIKGLEDFSDTEIGKLIDIDQRKNKAKGFLYSYILGANRSLSKELIVIKKTAREISNIISAILNSPDKRPTQFQKDDLLKNAKEFDVAFKSIDTDSIDTNKLLLKYENELSVATIKNILRNSYLINKVENLFDIFDVVSSESNYESAISKIYYRVNILEKEYFANRSKLKLSEKINLANIKLTRFDEEKSDFFKALINEYISFDFQNESRLDIATLGIKLLMRMYEEQHVTWNPSPQRDFFNGLLANLQGKGVFNINSSYDIIHQSFALFVLHKEKDELEKLEATLIANVICEYRFVFGLWGAFNGFANMPKTLTNELFLTDNINYLSETYKYIYKQVHGIELDGELIKMGLEKFTSYPSKVNERLTINTSTENLKVNSLVHELSIFDEFNLKDKKFQNEVIFKLNEIGIKSLSDWNNKTVENIKWSTSKGQKKLMTAISKHKSNEKLKNPTSQPQEKNLFMHEPEKDFYKDFNVYDLIEDLLPNDKKIKLQFKVDLDWFQDEYRKGDLSQYYSKASRENSSVIDAYNRYLLKKNYSAKLNLEKISSKLKELYL